ncbi:leucine-rich repeat domain-containing protein [Ascidiimonas sp. W6]|uniref:leucine-rich repeat domain-containing protein n=1 Tax=Ascidiimonas meishanensis TaxID=3128903 RepID=UPI0030ED20A1
MGNIEQALVEIERAEQEGLVRLNLGGLGLTDNDLKELISKIQKISNLEELHLADNNLTALPSDICNITSLKVLSLSLNNLSSLPTNIDDLINLESLDLSMNQFSTLPHFINELGALERLDLEANELVELPEQIGYLDNLKELIIADNSLTALPPEIGYLPSIERFNASHNALTALPESILNYNEIDELNLKFNPLSEETRTWLYEQFGYEELVDDQVDYDISVEVTVLYPETHNEVLKKIDALDIGTYDTAAANKKTAPDIIKEFLSKTPLQGAIAKEVYLPAAKELLDFILHSKESKQEKSTQLQKMATSLGDCATPVKSFLIQNAIDKQLRGSKPLTPLLNKLVDRETIENEINTKLKKYLRGHDKIEQVQGIVNSLFLEGAETHEDNKYLRIKGDRVRLESKTINIEFAFDQISKSESLSLAAAKLFCETDGKKKLIQNEEGQYLLSPPKIKSITSAHRAKLGLISDQERAIASKTRSYELEVIALLRHPELVANSIEKDIQPLMDLPTQQESLRVALFGISENEFDATYDKFLHDQKTKIKQALEKYSPQKIGLAELLNPMNDGRRSPSPDGDGQGKRKVTPSQNEASQNKRNRGFK